MKTIKYPDSLLGENWHNVSRKAKGLATKDANVEFEFNEVICVVSENTDLELLYRDYSNAWLMGWPEVGPNCLSEYPSDVQVEFDKRTKEQEEKRRTQEDESNKKDAIERGAFQLKTTGVKIDLIDHKAWDDWKAKNTDSYGAGIFEYAESWARLMQAEMSKGKTLIECAESTSFELGFLGITGFMYGASVSILSQCWVHGETLRKWHNKEYKHDGDGVVNPAILSRTSPS